MENYLPYLRQSNDVGHYMMDMIANTLGVSPRLMGEAQRHGLACRRLLNVMDNITAVAAPAFVHHSEALAIETHHLKPMMRFDGRSCSWYSTETDYDRYQRYSPMKQRVFHCAQTVNKTSPLKLSSSDKQVLASVIVPKSLYNLIDPQPSSSSFSPAADAVRLMFVAFSNSSLFPTTVESSSHEAVNSFVIGSQLLGSKRYLNLTDPIIVSISFSAASSLMSQDAVQPVWWDQYANGGYGAWNPDYCQVLNHGDHDHLITFSCSRLGYYGLRIQRSEDDPLRMANLKSKWHTPVLYVGTALAVLLLMIALTAYGARFSAIQMAREMKHSLAMVWLTSILLIYLYVMGIYQSDHEVLCRTVSLIMHFLTIACLMWLLVGVHIIYSKVSKRPLDGLLKKDDYLTRHELIANNGLKHDHHDQHHPERPLTRYYLFAFGVPGIIVAVCSAVSINQYQTESYCFMAFDPLAPIIGGLVVPAVLIVTVMVGFGLSTICVLAASPSRVTEHIGIYQ